MMRKEIGAEMALLKEAVLQQRAHIAFLRRHADALLVNRTTAHAPEP
ncbi:MAG TPA: hypothetical protein VIL30_22035 [Ramlibacter sp.]|jgi:hypothetical protein